MSRTVSTDSASAAERFSEIETPHSMDEAIGTGFLPDDEHYRLTGEFKSEKDDASATSKPDKDKPSEKTSASAAFREVEDPSAKPDASAASSSKAAASETAQAQKEDGRNNRENRWQKRERELRELREKVAKLESKPQTEAARSDPQQTSQAAAAETKSAKPAKPKIDDVDPKTGKAKYANFGEYEDAKDAYLRQETIREFQETTAQSARAREQTEAERQRVESFNKKFEAPRAKYQDFDAVALNPDLLIPAGSVTDLFLQDSEHAGEVLYHLGQHPELLGEFHPARTAEEIKAGKYSNKITPQQQFRKLVKIEELVSASTEKTAAAESSSEKSSSAKPVTQASRPPHQVSGSGTVAKDAVEQALEDGDFETYQRTQNAKELARLKRK